MLDKLTSKDFTRYIHQSFFIHLDQAEKIEVELIQVTELPASSKDPSKHPRRNPFSIVFRGPKDRVLPQKIYQIEHKDTGTLDLFIVPIGPDEEGMRYEAVFT